MCSSATRTREISCRLYTSLYKSGNYNAAYEKFEQAIRRLEAEYRRSKQNDDKELRDHNERKADIYCDMASLKMQMFDEKSAAELIEMSLMTCSNKRANELKYLIDGSGELSDERKAELDLKKDAVRAAARESAAYQEIEAIFRKDKMTLFKEARKLAAGWKMCIRDRYIVACGSAYHVGVAAKYVFEKMAQVPVEIDIAKMCIRDRCSRIESA